MSEQTGSLEHDFSGPQKSCALCGLGRSEARKRELPCLAQSPSAWASDEFVPLPRSVVLARPLAIVPESEPGAAELRVLLTDANARVAHVASAPVETFDADVAFRVLDDVRTRAETLYGWVVEGLAAAKPAAAVPRRSVWYSWGRAAVLSAVLAVGTLLLPAKVVLGAAALAWCVIGGVLCWQLWRAGEREELAKALAVLVFAPVLVFVFAPYAWEVALARVVAALGTVAFSFQVFPWGARSYFPTDDAIRIRPTEYLLHDGEATSHEPELCLVGDLPSLCVVVDCRAADNRLLRRVVLPVQGATRENAEIVARLALARDVPFARQRAQADDAWDAAASALKRVEDLERSRRSLPE